MLTDLRLKIRNFIKRNKWKLVIFIIAWAILIAINTILTNLKSDTPITTYTPFEPIIDNGQTMPKKWQDDIESIIKEYVGYCNQKEYEKAYEMISPNCRDKVYPTIEEFKAYVDYVFKYPKVYTVQNYSNRGNVYIYRIRLFEDILSTGMTYSESLLYFEEKLVFTEYKGKLQLAVKSYIGDEELDYVYEDQYMKITVSNRSMSYDEETYTIRIQNKTEYDIVLANDIAAKEIAIQTEKETTAMSVNENWREIYIEPQASNTYRLTFQKLYDEGIKTTGIKFNSVRILRSYSGKEETKEQELAEAISLYSFTMPLN